MEKILIVGCKQAMDDVCIGCSRRMVGLNRREGEFARYKDTDAEMTALLNCGDCPGATIVTRLAPGIHFMPLGWSDIVPEAIQALPAR